MAARLLTNSAGGVSVPSSIESVLPGFTSASGDAMDVVSNLLKGLPSADTARTANAYFGTASGLNPTSDFLRNRGYDLFNTQADARKQTGIQDLLALLQGSSGTLFPTANTVLGADTTRYGINTSANTAAQSLAEQARQFNLAEALRSGEFGAQNQLGYAGLGVQQQGQDNNSLNTLLNFLQ